MSSLRSHACLIATVSAALFCSLIHLSAGEASSRLWQIGRADGGDAEFALAPDGFSRYQSDGFFVVGESEPRRDWPYVQPGPGDSWAGSRTHTFTILFALKEQPDAGSCQLTARLVDTHSSNPPKLEIQVNGHRFEQELPKGGGDASIRGDRNTRRPTSFSVTFPSDFLRPGDNDVQVTTLTGNWILYDSLELLTPANARLGAVSTRTVVASVQSVRALRTQAGADVQPVLVTIRHFGAEGRGRISIEGAASLPIDLKSGESTFELSVPAVTKETTRRLVLEANGQKVSERTVPVRPVRKLTIFVLPHSHTDIGYTEIQTAIETKQVNNLQEGIAAARRTADYPEGARFVWNVEVLWAADLYLHRLSESQRREFDEAVQRGWIGLNGMYLNELTGLCRPEELLRLFQFSTRLAAQYGTPIDSAMISDVPGYTWGTVTAMAQAGIRYFSTAPNYFDRIGDILVQWENKPFWWVSPSGHEKVLVWIPYMGYAMSHLIHHFTPQFVDDYQGVLEKERYPYDIAYVRWSGHGDNAVPDPAICEFFKEWNVKYSWPKFRIARTGDAFREFEKRYGKDLPSVRGDWTPYWEDGAGSSALETALNRTTSDRLVQAETLFAMRHSKEYRASDFDQAWRNTLLYSEHTWGADCSVSNPESTKTKEQWAIKKSYAVDANNQSLALLKHALEPTAASPKEGRVETTTSVDVLNTTSWSRSELVLLPRDLVGVAERVSDESGTVLPSQRLTDGSVAFMAKLVPPFSSKRFVVSSGPAQFSSNLTLTENTIRNGSLEVQVDPITGGIRKFSAAGMSSNLADTSEGQSLNDYLFLPGEDLQNVQHNGQVKILVKENGPLVSSLLIESEAPGCTQLRREIRMAAGCDYIELIDTVEKKRAATAPTPGDSAFAQKGGKESVNFGFPFLVPDGEITLDIPLGWMRPEIDQMASACKNWFTVGRWADVANHDFGVTLVTLDAPLLEVGTLSANMTGSQTNPNAWRKKVDRTQRLYVWAMNNHWHTNYRAYQDGPVTFRFLLRPHRQFNPAEATRFATGFSQPLLPVLASGSEPAQPPALTVEPADVLVTSFKPSEDGKAWIVRLFGASGKDLQAKLTWGLQRPRQIRLSDTSEKPGRLLSGPIHVGSREIVTLRAERTN